MIEVNIRNRNTLTILSSPGKSPIISSAGSSPGFYNSMELLCIAYASCFAKHFNRLCMYNDINPEKFQSIKVDMIDSVIHLYIQHPNIKQDILDTIKKTATTCELYQKFLKCEIEVHFSNNEENFIEKEQKTSSCCGG